MVLAGDTGTIPFSYRDGCRNGAHHFNQDLARADSRAGATAQLQTVAPCTLSIPGHWAGPVTREIE